MRRTKYFLPMALAALLATPLHAQTVKAGIEAWQKGDPAAAVAIWKPLAEKGNADAAFNLGQAYRLGRGVPIDLSEAQAWLGRAARKDHVDAQVTLGLLLFENGNRTSGLRWLKGAAEKGEARAMLVYGTALFNGDGVPSDPVAAYAYVSRAAAQGLAPAKLTLAQMDSAMPLEQRQKGVAMALNKAKTPPPKSHVAAKAAAPAKPAATARTEPKSSKGDPAKSKSAGVSASPSPSVPKSGQWRIQLGAFSKRESAQALFNQLSAIPPVAGRQPYLVAAGKVTRLQVGPFESQSAAASACAQLAKRKQACFPTR